MKRWFKRASVLLLLATFGCSSAGPEVAIAPIDPLEQNAINALKASGGLPNSEAIAALDNALIRYRTLDDIAGQWRIHLMRIKLALSMGEPDVAAANTEILEELATLLDRDLVGYETALMIGRVNNDKTALNAALAAARSPLDEAVVLTYLGRTAEAVALIDKDTRGSAADRAFVWYQRARDTGSSALYLSALDDYRRAHDARGVADTLVSLARLANDEGNSKRARTYAGRAVRVLRAAGDVERADIIQRWHETL